MVSAAAERLLAGRRRVVWSAVIAVRISTLQHVVVIVGAATAIPVGSRVAGMFVRDRSLLLQGRDARARGPCVHVNVYVPVPWTRRGRRRGRSVERIVDRAAAVRGSRRVVVELGHLGGDAGHGQYQQYHADRHALEAEHGQSGQQRGDHAQLVHYRQHYQLQPSPVYSESPRVCARVKKFIFLKM